MESLSRCMDTEKVSIAFCGSRMDVKGKFGESELTELFRARDASCSNGEQRKSLITRELWRRLYEQK